MKNKKVVDEWLYYAKSDFDTAQFLNENMYPKPLGIICYHCQQAAEKFLKMLFIINNIEIKKHMIYLTL